MSPQQLIGFYQRRTTDRSGCGAPVIFMCLLIAFLLVGCRTITNQESNTESHHIESLLEKVDSLINKTTTVKQDSVWRETVIKELQSIREKSDTSHTLVVDTTGKVIKEKIVINNTKEVTSEKDRQEIIGMIHRLEKLDSTLSVQNEQISKIDSLLKEKNKETTIEKKQPWWQSFTQLTKGIIIGILLSVIVFLVLRLKKILP